MGNKTTQDPYAAFRYSSYRLYFIGRLIQVIGGQMQAVAISWELYERTHSAMVLAWLGLVQVVPIILLALPAGHTADRFNRKKVAILGLIAQALCSLALLLVSLNKGPVPYFYLILFFNAMASAFITPSTATLVPMMLPLKHFANAATWQSSSWQVGTVIGPALGGWLIAVLAGSTYVYGFTMLAILCYCLFLAGIRVRQTKVAVKKVTLHSLAGGVRFVWTHPILLSVMTLDLFAVLFGGAVALLPIYAKDILQVGPAGLGWLRAAPSVGAMVMIWFLSRYPILKQAGKALFIAVAGFGVATIGFGMSHTFWFSLVLLAIVGGMDNISVVVRHTLVMVRTPDAMRGRVQAVNNMFISISNELGWFESGLTAWLFGPVISVVGGGVATMLVVGAVGKKWPELVQLKSLQARAEED